MRMAKYLRLAFLLIQVLAANSYERYDGSQVWRLFPQSKEQVDALQKLEDKLDFWTDASTTHPVDVRTDSKTNGTLFEVIQAQNIKHELRVGNLAPIIEAEMKSAEKARTAAMSWDAYHGFDTIQQWLEQMSSQFKDISQIIEIGKSTEGRALKVIRIGIGAGCKRGHWIDGGIHAREWISPATVTWIINELLTNNKAYTELLTNLDFYILPINNPDGYEFSRNTVRLWRKTRSPNKNSECVGVDGNRNWDVGFGGNGSSPDPCSDIYHGGFPFSEPETAAVRKFIEGRNDNTIAWRMYNSVHAYSQWILFPWSYKEERTPDYNDLMRLANTSAAAVFKVHGSIFVPGTSLEILDYIAAGSSMDWVKLAGHFQYSYTYELRDTGDHGFLLPPEQIVPAAKETWEGVLVMARFAQSL